MKIDLAAYNAWKRATLDRVSAKYAGLFMRVIRAHLAGLEAEIERALQEGARDLNPNGAGIGETLERVLIEHFKYTVKVGVSDGIREVTPDKKLATWTRYNWAMPVEDTFTSLAERQKRDEFFADVLKKIRKKYGADFADIVSLERERYLKNIKSVFRTIADDYFAKDDNGGYSKQIAREVIQRVFNKTKVEAERIFRTQTTDYFNEARLNYFKDGTDVDFVQLFAVTDGRISDICDSRANYVVPIGRAGEKKFKPPFHPNCRTIQSPLISYLKSDDAEIKRNLGSEFGRVEVERKDEDEKNVVYIGRRSPPDVPLPRGWA